MKIFAVCAFFLALHGLQAGESHAHYYTNDRNVAINGYDPVAYFTQNEAVQGSSAFAFEYGNLTYHFSTAKNRDLFSESPQSYLPQYGGWCALAAAAKPDTLGFAATRFPSDPRSFALIDGKLYLFANLSFFKAKTIWEKLDQTQLITNGDQYWAGLEKQAAALGKIPEGMSKVAPLETADFGFLIGEWRNTVKTIRDPKNGVYGPEMEGIWKAEWGTEGFMVIDYWRSTEAPGMGGPTIRTYNPMNKSWTMVYIPVAGSPDQVWKMEGRFDESGNFQGEFEGKDGAGRSFKQRVHFYNIEKNRFSWRADRSYDEGKTWIEGFMIAEQERIR